jgi:hypothetical protein
VRLVAETLPSTGAQSVSVQLRVHNEIGHGTEKKTRIIIRYRNVRNQVNRDRVIVQFYDWTYSAVRFQPTIAPESTTAIEECMSVATKVTIAGGYCRRGSKIAGHPQRGGWINRLISLDKS